MHKLTICIPTYNRKEQLKKNLIMLLRYIDELNFHNYIKIIVSDNNTKGIEKLKDFFEKYDSIYFYIQKENVGPEKNFINVINLAKTQWVMLLGDDDYIQKEYLNLVMEYIQEDDLTVIIPNFYTVDEFGNNYGRKKNYRDPITEDKRFPQGSLKLMFKAHQMSGLVFRKKNIIEKYLKNVKRNYYLQMFFVGENLLRGKAIHITRYPLANSVIKKKNFNYNIDNLIDHVLYNIEGLDIDKNEKLALEKYFISHDAKFRLGNRKAWIHPLKMISKINNYEIETKMINYIIFRFLLSYIYIPIICLKKVVKIIIGG